MKTRLAIVAASIAVATFATPSMADEGMWQPHQLPALENVLKEKGLEINPKNISKLTEFPMNAVVSLGGCTASFVSPKGLVITNHHCAYGSIQFNSTADNNLLDKGFLAKSLDEELQAAPGSRVFVTEEVTDVTAKVNDGIPDSLSGEARYQAIEDNRKALVAECEQDKSYRCTVSSFHGGLEFYLTKALAIRDVRLVHAPAKSVGKYGGDIDNWMWPRHTGDYSFYRAYVGKDGKPADFSEDNVPYVPKSFLKVSAKGVSDSDFVMVAGYPGRTNRYRLAEEVRHAFGKSYPQAKEYREQFIDIIKEVAPEGSDARVKYESTIASLANYAKNYGSMLNSYSRSDFQARKDQLEKDLTAWINADKKRMAKYGESLSQLNALIQKEQATWLRDLTLGYAGRTNLMRAAKNLYRLAHEKQKPDAERERGYQERDLKRFEQSMKRITRRYEAEVEKAVLQHFFSLYAKLDKSMHLESIDDFLGTDKLNEKKLAKKLDKMFKKTKLGDEQTRLDWMNASVEDFKKSKDPFIQLAVATFDDDMKLEKQQKAIAGEFQTLRPKFMEAIIVYNQSIGKPVYADANSTLRVTYGNVKGYSPKDGNFMLPFTTLRGLEQKETGEWPFNSPEKLLNLVKAKQHGDYYYEPVNSVPVNFLSTLDTTGGNSGSPTLNGKAELVGLLFDGVFESVIGDWDFDDNLNRSIHVDSRYMLWVMQNVDHADNLLREMAIVK
ncbi:S46 family peptidase [Alteromonas sp. a30]|uniref:S46 family peptidase n=1 Tax=Alteromonas sp. a30 TaxID=2730917 RepID=UPI00227DCD3A|nr:S46 family peptidase [Alteromonas sp. a30]MCY7296224.1 S46 family peptidase [Alteromonas sp. a30]